MAPAHRVVSHPRWVCCMSFSLTLRTLNSRSESATSCHLTSTIAICCISSRPGGVECGSASRQDAHRFRLLSSACVALRNTTARRRLSARRNGRTRLVNLSVACQSPSHTTTVTPCASSIRRASSWYAWSGSREPYPFRLATTGGASLLSASPSSTSRKSTNSAVAWSSVCAWSSFSRNVGSIPCYNIQANRTPRERDSHTRDGQKTPLLPARLVCV